MKLTIVTASTDLRRAESCIRSWRDTAVTDPKIIVVLNGGDQNADRYDRPTYAGAIGKELRLTLLPVQEYLGTVPAFAKGVEAAFDEVIACLHDDLEIQQTGWDDKVLEHFRRHPACGLAGFGGAIGLGDEDMYEKPYNPVSLARKGFRSNMTGAELHGIRSTLPERVACLDSFSMIFKADFARLAWNYMQDMGIVHHFHDGAAACLAARHHHEVWYLPVRCHHYGGRTAVGDTGYQEWAKSKIPEGDTGFWTHAHKISAQEFRDVLPIRV